MKILNFAKGSATNDVTQFWTIFDPFPTSSRFLLLSLLYSRHKNFNPFHPLDRDVIMDAHLMRFFAFRKERKV